MAFALMNLTRAEKKQLDKITGKFDYHFSCGVKTHMEKAGKLQQMDAASTPAEQQEQIALMGQIFSRHGTLASARISDIFTAAARRVESDAILAQMVPTGKNFSKEDITLLDKCRLENLAALAKLRP